MDLSPKARALYDQIADEATKLGELRRVAKEIRRDHALALELWSTSRMRPRQLAILIMDPKQVDQGFVDQLDADLQALSEADRTQLMDWLLAHQLTKSRAGTRLIASWEQSDSALQRRTYWYHQARLRWTGQTPPPNTAALLDALEARMADEVPEVQWAMNFTAGQIGTYDPDHRDRCVALGERTGLYRDEVVARGCTPQFLPTFIRIQVGKLGA